MSVVDPGPEQLTALAESGHSGPVQMVNLLRFKPGDGVASYGRYLSAVEQHLAGVGGRVVAGGGARHLVIGDGERPWWDAILTVEYPSIDAFLRMVASYGYGAVAHLRTEALSRAELIATAPNTLDASS